MVKYFKSLRKLVRVWKKLLSYTTDMNIISVIFLEGGLSVSALKTHISNIISILEIYSTKLLAKAFYTYGLLKHCL